MSEVMAKLRVGIVFGGKSAEHEVSLQSAKNIVNAIDKSRFEVVLLGIDKQGQWHINDEQGYLLNADDPAHIALNPSEISVATVPGVMEGQLINASTGQTFSRLSTARWAKMAPCRGCCEWLTCRLSAPTCSALLPAWIKTSPSACCAMPG